MKIEIREIKFSRGVIAWDFLLIFYFSNIESKWLGKVSFSAKNRKDMLDDGTYFSNAGNLQIFEDEVSMKTPPWSLGPMEDGTRRLVVRAV